MARFSSVLLLLSLWNISSLLSQAEIPFRTCGNAVTLFSPSTLPDSAFTASSYLNNEDKFRPANARFASMGYNPGTRENCWCASKMDNEWIQVDFGSLKLIDTIFLSRRLWGNEEDSYVPYFNTTYQRTEKDNGQWFSVNNTLSANNRGTAVHVHKFEPRLTVRRLRIHPLVNGDKFVKRLCLVFDLHGFNFPDGVISYSTKPASELKNSLYNMGPLMDCKSSTSLSLDVPSNKNPVIITFNFDAIYNFSWIQFDMDRTADPNPSFNKIEVDFSQDGQVFPSGSTIVMYNPNIYSPLVQVDLAHNIASVIMIKLYYDQSILITKIAEVKFANERAKIQVPEVKPKPELPPVINGGDISGGTSNNGQSEEVENPSGADKSLPSESQDSEKNGGQRIRNMDKSAEIENHKQLSVYMVTLISVFVVLILAIVLGLCFFIGCRRWNKPEKLSAAELDQRNNMAMTNNNRNIEVPQSHYNYHPVNPGMQWPNGATAESSNFFNTLRNVTIHNGLIGEGGPGYHPSPFIGNPNMHPQGGMEGGSVAGGSAGMAYSYLPTTDEDDSEDDRQLVPREKGNQGSTVQPYAACSVPRTHFTNVSGREPLPSGPEYASAALFNMPPPTQSVPPLVYPGIPSQPPYNTLNILTNPVVDHLEAQKAPQQPGTNYYTHSAMYRTLPGIPKSSPLPSHRLQGVTGNVTYSLATDSRDSKGERSGDSTGSSTLSSIDSTWPEIAFSQLKLLGRLGGGHFGEIHLAGLTTSSTNTLPKSTGIQPKGTSLHPVGDSEASAEEDGVVSNNGDKNRTTPVQGDTTSVRSGASDGSSPNSFQYVTVKFLRKDASDQTRRELQSEVQILSRLTDANIARFLGVCREQGSLLVIQEHTKHGDLYDFLRNRHPSSLELQKLLDQLQTSSGPLLFHQDMPTEQETRQTLSYGCVIFMAMQISSGMHHLESQGVVHRDLSCRNCHVDSHFQIKISDVGMSRRHYSTDYYTDSNLPIRWMSWESLLQGRFSSKSDVWAFAVTLWEMLTFCRQQPLAHLSNQQVVDNLRLLASDSPAPSTKVHYPFCPPSFPREIYDLLHECWQAKETSRPSFREIDMFLRRKNCGFNAEDEYQLTKVTGTASSISPMLNS